MLPNIIKSNLFLFQYSRSSRRLSILPEENEAEDCLSTSSNSNENGEFGFGVFNRIQKKRTVLLLKIDLRVKNYLHAIENVPRGGTLFSFSKVIDIKSEPVLSRLYLLDLRSGQIINLKWTGFRLLKIIYLKNDMGFAVEKSST